MKRSAWKCCDLAPTACSNNESGHRYLGSQRQVGGMLLHSRWHRNWCRALKPKGKSVVLNLPKGSSLTLLIYNNKVWEKADISSCKTCLCKENWKKKKVKFWSNGLHLYLQWVWSAAKPTSAPQHLWFITASRGKHELTKDKCCRLHQSESSLDKKRIFFFFRESHQVTGSYWHSWVVLQTLQWPCSRSCFGRGLWDHLAQSRGRARNVSQDILSQQFCETKTAFPCLGSAWCLWEQPVWMVDCVLKCWKINAFDIQPLVPGMMVQDSNAPRHLNACASYLFRRF